MNTIESANYLKMLVEDGEKAKYDDDRTFLFRYRVLFDSHTYGVVYGPSGVYESLGMNPIVAVEKLDLWVAARTMEVQAKRKQEQEESAEATLFDMIDIPQFYQDPSGLYGFSYDITCNDMGYHVEDINSERTFLGHNPKDALDNLKHWIEERAVKNKGKLEALRLEYEMEQDSDEGQVSKKEHKSVASLLNDLDEGLTMLINAKKYVDDVNKELSAAKVYEAWEYESRTRANEARELEILKKH